MFEEMREGDAAALDVMSEGSRVYLEQHLPTGEFVGWVAEVGGVAVATGGIVVRRLPPSVRNTSGLQGYILNICTLPEWRRRGIATAIVEAILEFLREQKVGQAVLHASEEGRRVYSRLGFESHPEMRLFLGDGWPEGV